MLQGLCFVLVLMEENAYPPLAAGVGVGVGEGPVAAPLQLKTRDSL